MLHLKPKSDKQLLLKDTVEPVKKKQFPAKDSDPTPNPTLKSPVKILARALKIHSKESDASERPSSEFGPT